MERLKPMGRFHLPFATLEETIFRMVSMHLVAQYFQKQSGRTVEWNLDGLAKVYAEVGVVNRDFAQRLRERGLSGVREAKLGTAGEAAVIEFP